MTLPPMSDDVYKLYVAKYGEPKAPISASKYKNARTEANGMTFQSGKEAAGVAELILLEEQHQIFALRLQVRFPLPGKTTYVADAVYLETVLDDPYSVKKPEAKKLVVKVVDFKGYATPEFKLKAKLFRATYGQEIELR